jgi:putative spermidine/putrescine transport system permease protein
MKSKATPWFLSGPALLMFAALLLVPLALTAVLSFNVYDPATGPEGRRVHAGALRPCVHRLVLRRDLLAHLLDLGLVTLICIVVGAPEAYILSRMGNPWRSILLLVVLAPLLVSVVVRAFGWSMLLGPEGLVNRMFGWSASAR